MTVTDTQASIPTWVAVSVPAPAASVVVSRMRLAISSAISSVMADADRPPVHRFIVGLTCVTTWKSRLNRQPTASIPRSAYRPGANARLATVRAPSRELHRRPVPLAVVRARCVCSKAFSVFSRPARNATATARSFRLPARPVLVWGVSRKTRHSKSRSRPELTMACVSVPLAMVNRA